MALPSLRSQLKELHRIRCDVFQTTLNPGSIRNGAKYLKAPLRGPAMVRYYPKPMWSIGKINRMYPGFNLVDIDEVVRLNDVEDKKKRGKGVPKKLAKGESRRAKKKK